MYLVRLIYTSTVSEGFNEADIEQILESGKRNNHKDNITGLLCFNSNYFVQSLEGSRRSVNETYRKIVSDDRHRDIVLLQYTEVDERAFPQWSVGYIPESSVSESMILKYSGSSNFDPYCLSGESCSRLLLDLVDAVPVF